MESVEKDHESTSVAGHRRQILSGWKALERAGGAQAWQAAVRSVWYVASSPWLLLVLSTLLVLLLALTWVLPQVPGQLNSEAGVAERWLATTASAWGGLGSVFRASACSG